MIAESLFLQPPVEGSVALGGFVVFGGEANGFTGANENSYL